MFGVEDEGILTDGLNIGDKIGCYYIIVRNSGAIIIIVTAI